jgi:hypothetical protein
LHVWEHELTARVWIARLHRVLGRLQAVS